MGEIAEPVCGATLTGRVQGVERYGVFFWIGPGRVGLMPRAWTGTAPQADLSQRFPVGAAIELSVVVIGAEHGKLAFEADSGSRYQAPPGVDARVIDQKAGREIVAAVEYDIDLLDRLCHRLCIESIAYRANSNPAEGHDRGKGQDAGRDYREFTRVGWSLNLSVCLLIVGK